MQTLAKSTQTAPASEAEYWTWANNVLDELSLKHQGHGQKYVKGCEMCLIKSARFAARSPEANAFLESAKNEMGVANINRIIQTFALAMGDKEFVKELEA